MKPGMLRGNNASVQAKDQKFMFLGRRGFNPFSPDSNSVPPGGEKEEKRKAGISGIGRIGVAPRSEKDEIAPVNRGERKNRFNFDPAAGRDYAADAPADKRPPSAGSNKSDKPKPVPIKSPAQVAAEKAEEWKRQQIEAENKKKEGKSYVIKKKVDAPTSDPTKDLGFNRLEQELAALAEAQK